MKGTIHTADIKNQMQTVYIQQKTLSIPAWS